MSPARPEPDLLTVAQDLDQLPHEHLDVALRVVAGAGGHRLEAAHVAVVVGAQGR